MNQEFYISLIGEAFDGYSEAYLQDKPVYIKHVTIRDQRYLHKYYEKYKKIALDRGLESEKDRHKYVLKEGIWSDDEDLKISSLEKEVENLKATAKAVFCHLKKKVFLRMFQKGKKSF